MNVHSDPYDRHAILDALVDHAWDSKADHIPAFKALDIDTKQQLREAIEKGIEGSDTRAFKAEPVMVKDQAMPREIYELPLRSAEGKQMVVVINPNVKNGQLLGGTCYVPSPTKDGVTFDKAFQNEIALHEAVGNGHKPRIELGGRPALREREQHQQVSTDMNSTAVTVTSTREPTMIEKLQERQKAQIREPSLGPKPKPPTQDL
jgi:hypothetical protein